MGTVSDINMAGVEHKLPGEYDIDGMKMSCCFPRTVLDRIRTVKLYDDDVIITCYPKSGKGLLLMNAGHHNTVYREIYVCLA